MKNKADYIRELFSSISGCYDLINILITFNQIKRWRRFAASKAGLRSGGMVLDVATGTGEMALEMSKYGRVVGVDFCKEMLSQAKRKADDMHLVLAMAENLPFRDNAFDCATISLALRDVDDVMGVISEMVRVIKDGGKVICLETCRPSSNGIFHKIYRFYLSNLIPLIGALISRRRHAYAYLCRSIAQFLTPQQVRQIMKESGLKDVQVYPLTGGIATVFVGVKK